MCTINFPHRALFLHMGIFSTITEAKCCVKGLPVVRCSPLKRLYAAASLLPHTQTALSLAAGSNVFLKNYQFRSHAVPVI